MGGSSLGLMEILCREWTGQIDRAGLPAQPRSDPTDGQNGVLPWRQSLGQAEPQAPKWQNSGGGTAHSLFHGDGTAAQPQGPTAVHSSVPHALAQKEGMCAGVESLVPSHEKGRVQGQDVPRGSISRPPTTSPQPLGRSPSQTPTSSSSLALLLLGPTLLSAFVPRPTLQALG